MLLQPYQIMVIRKSLQWHETLMLRIENKTKQKEATSFTWEIIGSLLVYSNIAKRFFLSLCRKLLIVTHPKAIRTITKIHSVKKFQNVDLRSFYGEGF